MNILCVTGPTTKLTSPYNGGTETFVHHLCDNLGDSDDFVTCITGYGECKSNYEVIEYEKSIYDLSDRMTSVREASEMYSSMSLLKTNLNFYDIVHYNCFHPDIFNYAQLTNHNAVITLHIPPNETQINVHKSFSNSHINYKYVAVSESIREMWQPYIKSDIKVIENGVKLNIRPYEVSSNKNDSLLWAGRICEEKNTHYIINLVKETGRSINIVGPIFNKNYFDNKIRPLIDNQQVKYLGHISQTELFKLYRESQALVLATNWQEPFGLTVIEALSEGLPVILTPKSFSSKESKANGLIYSKLETTKDLIESLEKAKKFSRSAIKQDAKIFDIENTIKKYREVYAELLSKSI